MNKQTSAKNIEHEEPTSTEKNKDCERLKIAGLIDTKDLNPFEEAQQQNDCEREDFIDNHNEQTDPKVMKPTIAFGKASSFILVVVIGLLFMATFFSQLKLYNYQTASINEMGLQSTEIKTLKGIVNNLNIENSRLNVSIEENSKKINLLLTDSEIISEIGKQTVWFRNELETQKSEIVNQASVIKDVTSDIIQIKKILKRPNKRKPPSYPVIKKKIEPVITKPEKKIYEIEDATLASIDIWGNEVNAVLRTKEGSWKPLAVGELYKGWRFLDSEGNSAVFARGGKTLKLSIRE